MEVKKYLPTIIDAARDAGIEILEVYNSEDFEIVARKDDSPLTRADRNANRAIEKKLAETGFPILSEDGEKVPFDERKNWDCFWMVDPLDGTKEFIKKNDEFTVNIALIYHGEPVLGVVYSPVLDKLYFGGKDIGSYMDENMDREHKLELVKNETDETRIVVSRSHVDEKTEEYVAQYKNAKTVLMGSSLKFMLIADSKADIYPRFSPTMEWDTAAAHAVLKGMGIEVLSVEDHQPLKYNKENLLNPSFIVNVLNDTVVE